MTAPRRSAPPARTEPLLTLTVDGPPRTKKTSNRIGFVGKKGGGSRPIILPSVASGEYAVRVMEAFGRIPLSARRGFPLTSPVHVCATFYVATDGNNRVGDLHGYQQSLADALQPHVLLDDMQIESWDGTRRVIGDPHPRTEVTISPLSPLAVCAGDPDPSEATRHE